MTTLFDSAAATRPTIGALLGPANQDFKVIVSVVSPDVDLISSVEDNTMLLARSDRPPQVVDWQDWLMAYLGTPSCWSSKAMAHRDPLVYLGDPHLPLILLRFVSFCGWCMAPALSQEFRFRMLEDGGA